MTNDSEHGAPGPAQDLIALFERYATLAGAQVSIAAGEAAAAALVAGSSDSTIRCAASVRERYPGFCLALGQSGRPVQVTEELADATASRSTLAADLSGGTGIVLARAGVAETGSLVLADDALADRLLSMLADLSVALLPAGAILPSLDEAGELLSQLDQAGHRYVSLVTGPSRSADIERVLTIGVQGPKALHIVVLIEEGC